MVSDLLIALSSNFDYHLRVELENPCLFDNNSLDCFLYREFFVKPPTKNIFRDMQIILLNNSEKAQFKHSWHFDPFKASFDIYQTKYFAPLLLFVNNVPSILNFHPDFLHRDFIYYPNKNFIETLWTSLPK